MEIETIEEENVDEPTEAVEKAATTEMEVDNSDDEIHKPDKKETTSTNELIDNFPIDSPILPDLNIVEDAAEDVEEEEDCHMAKIVTYAITFANESFPEGSPKQ
ncbi:hypothetical protein V6N13_032139 [Hibiscus sabdariffa]